MRELADAIPDANVVVGLSPEELACKLLLVLRKRAERQPGKFSLQNLVGSIDRVPAGEKPIYPSDRVDEVKVAVVEAFAWLEGQALLVPDPNPTAGMSPWRFLSRRARQFEDEREFLRFATSRELRRERLHPALADRVWLAFVRGELDTAVFHAMKAVEVSVREAAGYAASSYGVPMLRKAFDPKDGPLLDPAQEQGRT